MRVNAYEYDNAERLRCMARNIDHREMCGDDVDETDRVTRELRATGRSQIGGGAAPHIVLRIVREPTHRELCDDVRRIIREATHGTP